ncbi:hypothetical protein [Yoonia sp. SS1-5]|uniref:UDP-glucose 6-dehydrogenase n=1 Tax=Yoonia rhodophyticola TaxID=3137370 RepID=A0AAN0M779_9RHOB
MSNPVRYTAETFVVVGLGHIGLPIYYTLGQSYGVENVFGVDKSDTVLGELRAADYQAKEPGITLSAAQKANIASQIPEGRTGPAVVQIAVDVSITGSSYDVTNLLAAIQSTADRFDEALIIVRSTISPDAIAALEGVELGPRQGLVFVPEFMREGLALKDIATNPVYHGLIKAGSAFSLGTYCDATTYDARALTIVKIANNAWRAEKVAFANLLAMISEAYGADPEQVSGLFLSDPLNVTAAYLRPGAPFGGYCLPKETQMMAEFERAKTGTAHFQSVLDTNDAAIRYWVEKILATSPQRVVFETFSFKTDIMDLRNSPYLVMKDQIEAAGITVVDAAHAGAVAAGDTFVDISCKGGPEGYGAYVKMNFSPADNVPQSLVAE